MSDVEMLSHFTHIQSAFAAKNKPDSLLATGPAIITHLAVYDSNSGWSVNMHYDDGRQAVLFGGKGPSHFACEVFVPKGASAIGHMNGDATCVLTSRRPL